MSSPFQELQKKNGVFQALTSEGAVETFAGKEDGQATTAQLTRGQWGGQARPLVGKPDSALHPSRVR